LWVDDDTSPLAKVDAGTVIRGLAACDNTGFVADDDFLSDVNL
jgi:hypothetical protein